MGSQFHLPNLIDGDITYQRRASDAITIGLDGVNFDGNVPENNHYNHYSHAKSPALSIPANASYCSSSHSHLSTSVEMKASKGIFFISFIINAS